MDFVLHPGTGNGYEYSQKGPSMKTSEFLLLLDELMELPAGTLKGPETLDSLSQWDSLASVGFIALVDRHLGMAADPGKIAAAETIADLVALVKDKLQ